MTTRTFAYLPGNGRIETAEGPVPELKAGTVLVEVHNSLVSPGTELAGGWRALKALEKEPKPCDEPKPFGYSNAGVIAKVGEGVTRFKPGERVACIGAGYAQHATMAVVPHNLCFHLPDEVSFADGTYAMLAGTALQALRRGEPELGEYTAIVGLGIVGQLAAQLYRLNGSFVIGWDMIGKRTQLASELGADAVVQVGKEDEVEITKAFTGNMGLDAVVLAIPGKGDKAMESIMKTMKCSPDTHIMGRVIVVGGVTFEYSSSPVRNLDIRHAGRTGPGYHDEPWEVGPDYPPVFMRWTTRTNLELCLRLIAEKRLQVTPLTTHTIPLAEVGERIPALLDDPDSMLGVVFDMGR